MSTLRDRARQLRPNPTEAERTLWKHLRQRQAGGHRFRRQHPIGNYIVDFMCLERRLIVEVDGGQHSEQSRYDDDRTNWLRERGYRVLRFWNNQVLSETDAVMSVILGALGEYESLPPVGEG